MVRTWSVVVSVLLGGATTAAHHSVLGFDGTRSVTLRGVVADVVWGNPHTYIAVDVADGAARGRWLIESEGAVVLKRLGWTKTSVQKGDRIASIGGQGRDGARVLRCQWLTTSRGVKLPCYPATVQ
jgi:hypothetical protein